VSNCLDGAVHVWDWKSGRETADAKTPKYAFVATPSRDGRRLLPGCDGNLLHVLDLATGERVGPALALCGVPWTVEISPDAKHAAIAGSGDGIDVVDLTALDASLSTPATSGARGRIGERLPVGQRRASPLETLGVVRTVASLSPPRGCGSLTGSASLRGHITSARVEST
jgi:WD40 repeat protein